MNANSITKATLGRLPGYLQYLKDTAGCGRENISATAIAKALSLGEVQVRKDLASVCGAGKPKIGYERKKLISDIEHTLGRESSVGAVIIGAGKLGRALLDYDGFEEFGVKILAAFDANEQALSARGAAKPVLPMSELYDFAKANDIRIGIIAVGKSAAQQVLDRLCECGITAVLNFAPVCLKAPKGVAVKQENLALSLAHLKAQIEG